MLPHRLQAERHSGDIETKAHCLLSRSSQRGSWGVIPLPTGKLKANTRFANSGHGNRVHNTATQIARCRVLLPACRLWACRVGSTQLANRSLDILPTRQARCVALQARLLYPLADYGLRANAMNRDQAHRDCFVVWLHHIPPIFGGDILGVAGARYPIGLRIVAWQSRGLTWRPAALSRPGNPAQILTTGLLLGLVLRHHRSDSLGHRTARTRLHGA